MFVCLFGCLFVCLFVCWFVCLFIYDGETKVCWFHLQCLLGGLGTGEGKQISKGFMTQSYL